MISDRLFVYGTLMRGFDHPMARLLSGNADFISEARCQGRLYRVAHYPALELSDDPADIVHGELFRMRVPDELLREFDMYEACGEGFPQPTEYIRQICRSHWPTARRPKRGPMSTTGRSRTCRASPRAGSWSCKLPHSSRCTRMSTSRST